MADWSEQTKQRLANKEALAEAGHDVSPFRFEQTHAAAEIHKAHADAVPEQFWPQEQVRLAGRLLSLRRMGKVTFAHLQQEGVRIQLYFQRELTPDYPLLKKLDTGDLIGVMGSVFTTKTGEVTIRVGGWRLLTKSLLPLPDKFHGIRDKEVRYRQRYLDTIQNPEVTEVFRTRARVVRGIRRFLEARGFLEVETPVIVPIAGGTEARPFTTHHNALSTNFNLRIALELSLKRLLVGGIERVYEIGRVFRNEGIDLSHNPEFTMLELYWAYADYNDVADLVEEMISGLAQDLYGNYTVPFRGTELNFTPPFSRIDFVDSLVHATGIDFDPLDLGHLRNWADTCHPEMKNVPDYKLLDKLFGEYVEPKLQDPTFVFDFPLAISPLARRHRSRPGLTERWDLFIGGTEIAPAYSELNDALDQRLRFEEQVRRRAAGDDEAPEIDEDFLTALAYGMPPAGGLGVGIDRLTMVLADQSSLRDVILFPLLKPRQTDEAEPGEAEVLE